MKPNLKTLLATALSLTTLVSSAAFAAHELQMPPNELGQVMVLMYHKIGEPEIQYVRTPEHFRQDLETLYSKGYYLINLVDLLDGKIDVPAGKTPVVLTFDDAAKGQFNKINGAWDPNCAVGIIKEMHDKHPDFGMAGSFYLNADHHQSTQWSGMLQEMVRMGFELGNHTVDHPNLKKISDEKVVAEIAGLQAWVLRNVPGYHLRTMAMPFGVYPHDIKLAEFGEAGGTSFHNEAMLEVGANPGPSPYSVHFQPLHIPRIRGNDPYFGQYIEYFDKNPGKRFISDGNPNVITVPAAMRNSVRADMAAKFHVQEY